jgi:predicted transport protein
VADDAVDGMLAAVSRSLAERTGRSLPDWVEVVQTDGPDPLDQNAVRRWLRDVHGVPQNSQWAIADAAAQAAGWVRPSLADYVDAQYIGAKAALRPVYDALADALTALGPDVRAEGRSTYVPFVRGRQFAAVAAATRSRVDLGLRFTDPPVSARLEPAKGFAQATHVVRLTDPEQVDAELLGLARLAYDQNP